jgi:transposase
MENNHQKKPSATAVVKEIRRRTKRLFTAEEKIKIVLECLRGEDSVAAICRKYGIHQNSYYTWSKDFLEAGKRRLNGDTTRDANNDEVSHMVKENDMLKRELANLYLENTVLKKSINGFGSDPMSR